MNKTYYILLIIGLISINANAFNYNFVIKDFNTQNPIQNANVSIQGLTKYTTINGYALYPLSSGTYDYSVIIAGYFTDTGIAYVYDDNESIIYLNRVEETSIIRINIDDLTFYQHEIKIYDKDNGRLIKRGYLNETITLIGNKEYVIKPVISTSDSFNSLETLGKKSFNYSWAIVGLIVGLMFIVIILGFLKSGYNKFKR